MLATGIARRHGWALVGLAALLAFGAGISLGASAVAARTDRAYDRYLRAAEVGDLVVNPGLPTARAEAVIADIPGVVSVTSDDVLTASIDSGEPRTQSAVDSGFVQLRASGDGRYIEQDRPVILEGRMVRGGDDAIVSRETAADLHLEVGDPLPLAFWRPSYSTPGVGAEQDELVEPLGREEATVVGIAVFADEVLADHLYPRLRVVVDADLAAPYTCVYGDLAAIEAEALPDLAQAVPSDCSLSYRYFSVSVDGGAAEATAVTDRMVAAFNEENERLPTVAREADVGYVVLPTFIEEQRAGMARALAPVVTALRAFAGAAAVATVTLLLLLAYRLLRRAGDDVAVWRQMGVTRAARAAALSGPVVLAVIVGALGGLVLGWLASAWGVVGSAALVEPGRNPQVPVDVAVPVLGSLLVIAIAGVVAVGASLSARSVSARSAPRRPFVTLGRHLPPASDLGVRAATTGTLAAVLLVAATVAVTMVTATSLFTANLTRLVREPARYGWPYDAAVMVGFGYGGSDDAAIADDLDRPEVERWGFAALSTVTIDGRALPAVAGREGFDELETPVLDGRYPTGSDEIAVGRQTLDELDLRLGDEVEMSSSFGDRPVTISGVVVLPALGPYESNRADSGRGALLSAPLFADLVGDAEVAAGLEPGSLEATGLSALVAIDLADEVDPDRFFTELGDRRRWDRNGFESLAVSDPVRPPALDEAAALRGVPLALGGLLAATMIGGLVLGVAIATHGRRRELSLLRALGCSARDLRRSVRWHALSVAAIAMIVGLPLGVAAGRTATRAFFAGLGVADDVFVPAGALVVVALVAATAALLASVGPARAAAATPTSTGSPD